MTQNLSIHLNPKDTPFSEDSSADMARSILDGGTIRGRQITEAQREHFSRIAGSNNSEILPIDKANPSAVNVIAEVDTNEIKSRQAPPVIEKGGKVTYPSYPNTDGSVSVNI